MPPRLASLARLLGALFFAFFALHFLASSFNSVQDYETEESTWGETLGLDHYADWEAGVTGKVGDGLGRMKDGLGAIRSGLRWGAKGAKLGSLYEVSAFSPLFSPFSTALLPVTDSSSPAMLSSSRRRIPVHE